VTRGRCGFIAAGLAAAAMLLVSACAPVGPDYVKPEPDAPPAWNSRLGKGLSAARPSPAELARWWEILKDPNLSRLIAQAVKSNLSLKQAKARVRQARALRGISVAGLFPAVNASGKFQANDNSENTTSNPPSRLYDAGLDAAWELDVFGGVRRSVEAAQANLEAAQADLSDVLVSLAAEVALSYVEARTFQARLTVARANLASQENTYGFIQSRHEAGLTNKLALEQARYNLERTRALIPNLEIGREASLNRLAVLLGQAPGVVHKRLKAAKPLPMPPMSVAVGVPAEALRRRPDLRRAERNLAAQSAHIGVATADLYPRFRLSGSIGLEAVHAGDLLRSSSFFAGFLPTVSWKIFDAGAVRQNIAVQYALQEQYLLTYESTVLKALEEVENALTGYALEQTRRENLRQAVGAAQEAAVLSQDLYKAGLVNFDSVLDAQRSLLEFQDQLALSEGAVVQRLISLYKALGGGWAAMTPETKKAKPQKAETGKGL
jgi:NodT family efflux transporter outer membrane factor (OMF) lipoprotein